MSLRLYVPIVQQTANRAKLRLGSFRWLPLRLHEHKISSTNISVEDLSLPEKTASH